MNSNQDIKTLLSDQALPLAWIDLDRLESNIQQLKKMAAPLKIRLASKSIRCRSLIEKLLKDYPEIFHGVLAYHPDEAVWLAENHIEDIVVAYPYLRWFEQQNNKDHQWDQITFMVDSLEHLTVIDQMASRLERKINICFDIDLSTKHFGIYFGVHRSSIKTTNDLKILLEELKTKTWLNLSGIMGYEAQIAGVGDKNPFKKLLNPIIKFLKKSSMEKVITKRVAMTKLCKEYGHNLRFVNGGGTGSLHLTKKDPSVTELAAGSGLYSPLLFDYYQDFSLAPAAGFALEVTRNSKPKTYTLAGGGYIASGAIGPDKSPRPIKDEHATLEINEGCGEVQTPIYTDKDKKLGDVVLFRHAKAGELCERFNNLSLIENGKVNLLKTYRGEGQCFL